VVSKVRDTLVYFREHRQQIRDILKQPASPQQKPVTPESIAGGSPAQEHS
jgi:electron transport complex protein RnfG